MKLGGCSNLTLRSLNTCFLVHQEGDNKIFAKFYFENGGFLTTPGGQLTAANISYASDGLVAGIVYKPLGVAYSSTSILNVTTYNVDSCVDGKIYSFTSN
jgi:hypothetical protein